MKFKHNEVALENLLLPRGTKLFPEKKKEQTFPEEGNLPGCSRTRPGDDKLRPRDPGLNPTPRRVKVLPKWPTFPGWARPGSIRGLPT